MHQQMAPHRQGSKPLVFPNPLKAVADLPKIAKVGSPPVPTPKVPMFHEADDDFLIKYDAAQDAFDKEKEMAGGGQAQKHQQPKAVCTEGQVLLFCLSSLGAGYFLSSKFGPKSTELYQLAQKTCFPALINATTCQVPRQSILHALKITKTTEEYDGKKTELGAYFNLPRSSYCFSS
jgi:hypothetical protein